MYLHSLRNDKKNDRKIILILSRSKYQQQALWEMTRDRGIKTDRCACCYNCTNKNENDFEKSLQKKRYFPIRQSILFISFLWQMFFIQFFFCERTLNET